MRYNKMLKICVIVSSVFFVICFILSQTLADKLSKGLFWGSTLLLSGCIAGDIFYWNKQGLDVDKKNSMIIKRGFDDSTTLLVVYHCLCLVLVFLFNQSDNAVLNNNYVIIGTFIMTIIFEFFSYCILYGAKRDTAKLLNNMK